MTNRITGTNSGIDVDTVVKQSLSTEQNKIDKAYQQQKVYEYQQQQLKEIVDDVQDFYDKYLDILSGDSLLKSTAYETVKFTGTDSSGKTSTAVTAKGYAGADVTDYKVTVTQLASKATATVGKNNVVVGEEIEIKVGDGESIKIEVSEKTDGSNEPDLEKAAKELNEALKKSGVNVTAKYSAIAGGIVIESGEMGKNASFELKTSSSDSLKEYAGKNATGTIVKGDFVYEIDEAKNTFTVDNIQFTLNSTTTSSNESNENITALTQSDSDVTTTITSDDKITVIDGKTTTITSENIVTKIISDENGTLTTVTTVNIDGFKIEVPEVGKEPTVLSGSLSADMEAESYPTESSDTGIITDKDKNGIFRATKDLGNGIKIITIFTPKDDKEGEYNKVTKAEVDYSTFQHLSPHTETDTNTTISIESKDGKTKTLITSDGTKTTTQIQKDGSIKETKETLKEDGSGYNDAKTIIYSGAITLSGETDISQLKDTIVNFINDYNKVMETINEKLWETRDRDYLPLTEEQKAEMSESEIEAWEKKAQTGLLRNDSDLRRIQSSMKSAMSSMMSSTGLTLESIGIEPIDNYTTKNGMYKIDEDKLTQALTNNAEEVKDLFTRAASTTIDKDGKEVKDSGGVLTQLQSILKSEFKSSSSSLSKRAGFEGTSTESSNTLSKNISKQKTLIKELKSRYTTKETALYNKYSALEVMLEKLNAQSNSLYSMLGLSS